MYEKWACFDNYFCNFVTVPMAINDNPTMKRLFLLTVSLLLTAGLFAQNHPAHVQRYAEDNAKLPCATGPRVVLYGVFRSPTTP